MQLSSYSIDFIIFTMIDLLIYSIKVAPYANMVHSCHQLDVLDVIYYKNLTFMIIITQHHDKQCYY